MEIKGGFRGREMRMGAVKRHCTLVKLSKNKESKQQQQQRMRKVEERKGKVDPELEFSVNE